MSGVTLSHSYTSTVTLASRATTLTGAVNAGSIGVAGTAGTFWTFANDGIGINATDIGVQLVGGIVTNAAHSTIYGRQDYGVYLKYGTVENSGTILTGDTENEIGVFIDNQSIKNAQPGEVVNNAGGTIAGAEYGVVLYTRSATVVNAGTIDAGNRGAVYIQEKAAGSTGLVVVDPGAVFRGVVKATGGFSNMLEVTGTSAVALSGIGTKYLNFNTIDFAPGAAWTLSGDSASLAGGQEIDGFYKNNTIDLTDVVATSESFASDVLTLFNDGTVAARLDVRENANITSADFILGSITGGGTSITDDGKYQKPLTLSGHYTASVELVTNPTTLSGTVSAGSAAYGVHGRLGTFWTFMSDGGGITDSHDGVFLVGGRLTNAAGSTIEGGSDAGVKLAFGTVDNSGYIGASGFGFGVEINNKLGTYTYSQPGLLINRAGATIGGEIAGVFIQAQAATVVNAGSIAGGFEGAVDIQQKSAGASALVVVDAGAVFGGNVYTTPGYTNVLELAGTSTEALTGVDPSSAFENFSTIVFAPGAAWTLGGTTLGLADGQKIDGFNQHDTIDLTGFAASASFFTGGILTLTGGGASEFLTIAESPAVTSADFIVTADGNGGTDITATEAICYARGTRLLTPTGEVTVESLAIGDALMARFGGMRKIRWIGRQRYDWRFVRHNLAKIPVRIAPGALGEGMPARELAVSPGHSLLLGEVLILARDLVNGVTITQNHDPARDTGVLEYFQIEFEAHDCVVAEGCWAESFADAPGLRAEFHNAAEYGELYPGAVPPDGLRLCAPRPERGSGLAAALAPVVARAAATLAPGPLQGWVERVTEWRVEGWALDLKHTALPVQLELWLGARKLGTALAHAPRMDLTAAGKGRCAFRFISPVRLNEAARDALLVRRQADGVQLPRLYRDTGEALLATG